MAEKVRDLRSALERLRNMPGQLAETDVEVDPMAELAGVYRYVGAGGTVKRPTKEGPAMIFRNVKGHPDASVAIGVLASRKRVAALLDCEPESLGKMLYHSVEEPIAPVEFQGAPPCQEVVHLATDPDFDLNRLVPAPTNTPDDAGPTSFRFSSPRAHATSAQWQTARRNWDRHFRFPSVSVLILRLRSVPVSSRRQHRSVTMSFPLRVHCGKSR